jgi:hypothetical protein
MRTADDQKQLGAVFLWSCTLSQDIKLALIQVDHDVQIREATNTDVINEYADNLENLPPITVFHDGKTYWLADGFHRFAAATKLNRMKMPCEVLVGTKREAILYACGANSGHGLRRTNEDKRRAVERLLADEEWASWSDRKIGTAAGVTHVFVAKVRSQVVTVTTSKAGRTVTVDTWAEPETEQPALEKRTGSDGKQYPVKNKQPEPQPEPQIEHVASPKDSTDKYAAHRVTASEINGLASRVRQWQKDLAEKKRLTGGEYIDIDPIIDKVDVLVRMTRDMAFSGECPACQGKGCKECRKLGWVSVGVAKK